MKRTVIALFSAIVLSLPLNGREYGLKSPDGHVSVTVSTGRTTVWSVRYDGEVVLLPSAVSMDTDCGCWGRDVKVRKVTRNSVRNSFDAVFYVRSKVLDEYEQLEIAADAFSLVFRAYDDGVAYRFVSSGKRDVTVNSEQAEFNFGEGRKAYIPYVRKTGDFETQFFNTFENTYACTRLEDWEQGRLAFLPLSVETAAGVRLCIAEAELYHYPGMYLYNQSGKGTLCGVFPGYPKRERQGSHNPSVTIGGHNKIVVERENYIAKCDAGQAFPWRVVAIADNDAKMLDSDLVYKLSSPCALSDVSWIRPGLVAWEWWNDRNITGVDFKAGVNNGTYKYYIDFAAANHIPYVVLDDGWYDAEAGSAFAVVPSINLEELVSYADGKNVGLLLWVGNYVFDKEMEEIMKHYSSIGIKGFKLDAIGRDDQKMNEFYYKAAELAVKYKVILDYHGGAKPAGMNRTYPNVLNFEGVHGLEQLKNKSYVCDLVRYDVEFPFIRGIAGPLDYTQGAMRNGTRETFRAVWSEPMSQGTRCRQLAEYVLFFSPLNMLCDSPVNYMKEQECTDFITGVPTVWKDTKAIDGKIGDYLTIARQDFSGNWFLGSIASWAGRKAVISLSFLGPGRYKAVVFKDGANADRNANDYRRIVSEVSYSDSLDVDIAPGGGLAVKFIKM